jgi:phosphate-selective porin OprO and OprP
MQLLLLPEYSLRIFRIMQKALMATVFWVITATSLLAQNETDEAPLLGVKNGISFRKDSVFSLNLRFRMQNRMAYFYQLDDSADPVVEARVRRLRLRLDGFLLSSKLSYYIQLSFSRADQDLVEDVIAQTVRDAMIYYRFSPSFYIGFGQGKLPGNRQRVISSGNIQMPDRSVANQLFTIDRDFGIFTYKTIQLNTAQLQLKTAISTGDGRNALPSNDGLAYTGRVEFLPLGDFKNSGDYSEGDLEFEPSPKLSLAATYSFNQKAVRTGGQLGKAIPEPVDMQTFIADMMFKYNGWALLGEYFDRSLTSGSRDGVGLNTLRSIPQGRALNLQASRMIGRKSEVILRYTTTRPSLSLRALQPEYHTRAVGYTRYFQGHRIKLQSYLGLDDRLYSETPVSGTSYKNRLQAMVQMELGI